MLFLTHFFGILTCCCYKCSHSTVLPLDKNNSILFSRQKKVWIEISIDFPKLCSEGERVEEIRLRWYSCEKWILTPSSRIPPGISSLPAELLCGTRSQQQHILDLVLRHFGKQNTSHSYSAENGGSLASCQRSFECDISRLPSRQLEAEVFDNSLDRAGENLGCREAISAGFEGYLSSDGYSYPTS